MARASRGASRDWDAPPACVPAPAVTLTAVAGSQAITSCPPMEDLPEVVVAYEWWRDGAFFADGFADTQDIAGGAINIHLDDAHTYTFRYAVDPSWGFCDGWSPFSNEIDTH